MEERRESVTGNPDAHGRARRRLLLTLAATGGAFASANVLPREWTRPIIDTIVVPAHAQASGPVVGLFTTTGQLASIFDLLVAPVHAAPIPLGNIVVGNAVFDAAWDLVAEGYSICVSGTLLTTNNAISFVTSGNGARKGNFLQDFSIDTAPLSEGHVDGTILLFNQTVDGSQLSFDASFQGDETSGAAIPGGECAINSTTDARMSSPYADKDLA
ncbi:MAG: hypothetical protein AB7F99_14100 [Vicinamibacterales bacterium]